MSNASAFVDRADLTAGDWRALFQAFADSNLDAIVCIDSAGTVVEWSHGATEIFGWTKTEAIGASMDRLIVPAEMVEAHLAAMSHYLATGEGRIVGRRVEIEAVDRCSRRFPVELAVSVLPLRGETFFVARIRDITARRNRERQLEMVARELDHRVKNALAVMCAIAKLSAKCADVDDVPSFVSVLADRIDAYRRAHEMLAESQYRGADIEALLVGEMLAFRPELEGVSIAGPPVRMGARAALTIGMIVHEMTTNAVKHGALATPAGRVEIMWSLSADELVIDWTERDGPPVMERPTRRGFGSQLIKVGLQTDLGGPFRLDFPKTGLVGQVRVPASSLQMPVTAQENVVAPAEPLV